MQWLCRTRRGPRHKSAPSPKPAAWPQTFELIYLIFQLSPAMMNLLKIISQPPGQFARLARVRLARSRQPFSPIAQRHPKWPVSAQIASASVTQ